MSQSSAKNKTALYLLLTTLLVVVLAVAVVGWKRGWFGGDVNTEPTYETPVFSADYLPPDAGAVLHIKLREAQDSKYVKKEFGSLLGTVREIFAPREMQTALGVDASKDVDWIQVIWTEGDTDHPLVLVAGDFNPAKFKLDPKGLHPVNKPGDRYRLYEMPGTQLTGPVTLAPGDHKVLMCDKPSRVHAVLDDAATGRMPVVADATLADLFQQVDRKQTIWGVASRKKLEPLPAKLPDATLETFARPILQNADAVYGGITCGDNIQGTLHLQAESNEKAQVLEAYLREQCGAAKASYSLAKLLGIQNDYSPLLQFLGTGKVTRDGRTVTLTCQLPEK